MIVFKNLSFLCLSMVLFAWEPSNDSTKQAVPLLYADAIHMASMKERYQNNDSKTTTLVKNLMTTADSLLLIGPFSVMYKQQLPPSGDKHDYMSQGPYWWPDSTKIDGLPFIRRDGVVNPDRDKLTDRANLKNLIDAGEVLSRAYYFTSKEVYAKRVIFLFKTWFLDEATRMNPNLNFGQSIPGITNGRGIGIIETSSIGKIPDVIALIRPSSAWDDTLEEGLQVWMKAYLDWLLNSKNGKDEAKHPNNHGTWYDVQTSALALFTHQDSLAKAILEQSKIRRFDHHIMANGAQPKELARTKSFNYSTMNLAGLFRLAHTGSKIGVDLWTYENKQGVTLQKALDFLLPTALGEAEWTHQQISPIVPERLVFHLILAAQVYDPAYAKHARQLIDKRGLEDDYALYFSY